MPLFTKVSDSLIALGLRKTMRDPYKTLSIVLGFVRKLSDKPKAIGYFDSILSYLRWNGDTIKRIYDATDSVILARFLRIYITRMHIVGPKRRQKVQMDVNIRVPDIIIGEITSKCNLSCTGCYSRAPRLRSKDAFVDWDQVISEAKKIGIFNVFWSGGEPLMASKQIFELAEKHPDVWFSAFTNGTIIDEEIAKRALSVRNLVFLVSVNGMEKENDKHRGQGTYQRAFEGMRILRQYGVPFGLSVTVIREHLESAIDDRFVQACCDAGACFFMYFPFLPTSMEEISFGLTPQDRKRLYEAVLSIRSKFQISAFYSHLNFMGACAGGGRLVYINAKGDVQPCPFTPFTTHNVRDGLLPTLTSPLNAAYAACEKNHKDPLSMCYRLDNPLELAKILLSTQAQPVGNIDGSFFLTPPQVILTNSIEWKAISENLREGMDGKALIKKLEKISSQEG